MQLSVVITAYDEGPLLLEAVASAINQRPVQPSGDGGDCALPAYEIVVVADQGTDPATSVALTDIARRWPDVRILSNDQRRGVGGSRNTGIRAAQGDWIAFLDGDDVWLPHAIARRFQALDDTRGIGWVAGDLHRGPDPTAALEGAETSATRPGFILGNPVLRALLASAAGHAVPDKPAPARAVRLARPVATFREWSICWTGTVMARRDLLLELGGFSQWLRRGQDTHMWIRLAARADLLFVPEPLAYYRTRASTLARRGATRWGWDILATLDLLWRRRMWPWFRVLYRHRLVNTLNGQVAFLREQNRYIEATGCALASAATWPFQQFAWRGLAASLLRR